MSNKLTDTEKLQLFIDWIVGEHPDLLVLAVNSVSDEISVAHARKNNPGYGAKQIPLRNIESING